MKIRIDLNKRTNGKIQVCAIRSIHSGGFPLEYPSPQEARKALVALGLPVTDIDSKLELLEDIGPKELLHFQPQEISDEVLLSLGFRV